VKAFLEIGKCGKLIIDSADKQALESKSDAELIYPNIVALRTAFGLVSCSLAYIMNLSKLLQFHSG
jgi:hypothetical protein